MRPPFDTTARRISRASSGLRFRRLRSNALKASNWPRKRWFAMTRESNEISFSWAESIGIEGVGLGFRATRGAEG